MVFSIAAHTTLFVQVYTADFSTRGLTSVYRRRGLKSRPTLAMFTLISVSFTGTTIYWATWAAFFAIQIHFRLVQNIGMELSGNYALTNASMVQLDMINMFLGPFMVP